MQPDNKTTLITSSRARTHPLMLWLTVLGKLAGQLIGEGLVWTTACLFKLAVPCLAVWFLRRALCNA